MEQTLNIALKAGNLFRTLGLHNVTMDDIAHELGISKKTLYHQVPDKSRLISLVIDREYYEVKREAEQLIETSQNPVEELLKLNAFVVRYLKSINPSAIFDLRKQYPGIYDQSANKFSGLFADILRNNITRGKELGLYHQHIDCDVIISIHAVKYSHFQSIWEPDATTEKIEKMAHYYLQGLVTEQGNILLQKHIIDFNNYLK
jgi:TetR/AcrR family transcriptional regulator, cholesterol catabolism regulator